MMTGMRSRTARTPLISPRNPPKAMPMPAAIQGEHADEGRPGHLLEERRRLQEVGPQQAHHDDQGDEGDQHPGFVG